MKILRHFKKTLFFCAFIFPRALVSTFILAQVLSIKDSKYLNMHLN